MRPADAYSHLRHVVRAGGSPLTALTKFGGHGRSAGSGTSTDAGLAARSVRRSSGAGGGCTDLFAEFVSVCWEWRDAYGNSEEAGAGKGIRVYFAEGWTRRVLPSFLSFGSSIRNPGDWPGGRIHH